MQSDMCIYTHILHNIGTLVGGRTAVNAACHFVHVWHRFASAGLGLRITFSFKPLADWKIYSFAFDFNPDIAF
jgi:hypothetical protein